MKRNQRSVHKWRGSAWSDYADVATISCANASATAILGRFEVMIASPSPHQTWKILV
jgi:hypothetical protein